MLKQIPRPFDVVTWRRIVETVRPLLPNDRSHDPMVPGMEVGIMRIKKFKACHHDFIWSGTGGCFLQHRVAEVLRPVFDSTVKFSPCDPAKRGMIEIIPIHVSTSGFGESILCHTCGYGDSDHVNALGALHDFVDRTNKTGIIVQMPGMKVVDDVFRDAVESRKMTNVLFREL
jgi:hypothetical protein